jgi:hypothetical protein
MDWNDFNDIVKEKIFEPIPRNTLAKVRISIKPGGYDDPSRNWTEGYATRNASTGSIYLDVRFTILEGKYINRQVWGKIGLHSEKSEHWSNMGRAFVKSILSSATRISLSDNSEKARNLRKINSFADLDGLEFVAFIDIERDRNDTERNIVKWGVTPDHKDYSKYMSFNRGISEDL